MSTWADEYLSMVEDCEKRESRLTDWERGFIDSIRVRLEKAIPLSVKQTETLEKILDRASSHG